MGAPGHESGVSGGGRPAGHLLGWSPGQPMLYPDEEHWGHEASAAKRQLGQQTRVLPELSETEAGRRSMLRHPAMLVSLGLTVAAIATMIVLLMLGVFESRVQVRALTGIDGADAVQLRWEGPDAAYGLYAVGAQQQTPADLSQLIRGREAWIPKQAGLLPQDACLVVRPILGNELTPIALDAGALAEQGGQRVCLAELGPAAAG